MRCASWTKRTRPRSRSSSGTTRRRCTSGRISPTKHRGKSGQGDYNDVMVAHDENIGMMLDKLDELGIADDTIVMYSTDNGVHYNSWPDAGITPFRSEKNTNWEGGWRVPAFVRWPGKIKAGTVLERHRLAPGLAADVPCRRRRAGHQGEAAQGPQGRQQDVQGPHRRLQHAAVPDRRGEGQSRENRSSTSATTATSWRSGWATGRSC